MLKNLLSKLRATDTNSTQQPLYKQSLGLLALLASGYIIFSLLVGAGYFTLKIFASDLALNSAPTDFNIYDKDKQKAMTALTRYNLFWILKTPTEYTPQLQQLKTDLESSGVYPIILINSTEPNHPEFFANNNLPALYTELLTLSNKNQSSYLLNYYGKTIAFASLPSTPNQYPELLKLLDEEKIIINRKNLLKYNLPPERPPTYTSRIPKTATMLMREVYESSTPFTLYKLISFMGANPQPTEDIAYKEAIIKTNTKKQLDQEYKELLSTHQAEIKSLKQQSERYLSEINDYNQTNQTLKEEMSKLQAQLANQPPPVAAPVTPTSPEQQPPTVEPNPSRGELANLQNQNKDLNNSLQEYQQALAELRSQYNQLEESFFRYKASHPNRPQPQVPTPPAQPPAPPEDWLTPNPNIPTPPNPNNTNNPPPLPPINPIDPQDYQAPIIIQP